MIMSGSSKRERLVANQIAGAPDRMAKAERHLLAGEGCRAGRGLDALQACKLFVFAALGKRIVKLKLDVEIVFDDALVAARDENQMFNASFQRLVDHILDDRLVNDRQHFLWDCLGRWQESGSKASNRKHCFADFAGFAVMLVRPFR